MNQYLGQGPGYSFIHAVKGNKNSPWEGIRRPSATRPGPRYSFIHALKELRFASMTPSSAPIPGPRPVPASDANPAPAQIFIHSCTKRNKNLPGQARAAPRSSPGPDIHSFMH